MEGLIDLLEANDVLPKAKGTIDAIFYLGNGLYEIVDYKTSAYLPSQDEVDANIQVALYDLAFMECPSLQKLWVGGKKPKSILISMHYLRFGLKGVVQTGMSEEDRMLNKRYYVDTYTQMATFNPDDFLQELNTFCPWCDCCENCDSYKAVVEADESADWALS